MPADMEVDFPNVAMESEEDVKKKAEVMKEAANVQYMAKEYDAALKGYSEAVELCPNDPKYYGNRAACYMMLGQYQNAFKDARKSVDLDPQCAKACLRLIKCSIVLGDLITAKYEMDRLEVLGLGNVNMQKEKEELEFITAHSKSADTAYDTGDFRKAIFHLNRCCSVSTSCTRFKVRKAECWALLEKYQDAQDIVNGILYMDGQNIEALYIRGMCLCYQDNIDKGIAHLQQVLKLAPDHKRAISLYKIAKKLKVKKEEGNAAFKMDNYQLAYNCYTEALTIDPKNAATNTKLHFNRAMVAVKLGLIEDSIAECTAALNLDKNYLKALLRRAESYMLLKEYSQAVIDLEKVCKISNTREYRRRLLEAKSLASKPKRKDYYNILGITKTATVDDIKKAYKKKAKLHHPDRHANASEREKKKEEVIFKEISEAYNVLSDPQMRSRYDRSDDMYDFETGFQDLDSDDPLESYFWVQGDNRRFDRQYTSFPADFAYHFA